MSFKHNVAQSRIHRLMLAGIALASFGLTGVAYADGPYVNVQKTDVLSFADGMPTIGAATLHRSWHEVRARVSLADLDSYAAYTFWWVVFNSPWKCLVPFECGEADIFLSPGVPNMAQRQAANISVFYADGWVTGADGVANVVAHLNAGRVPDGTWVNFGNGLKRAHGLWAEIHLVVRTHGAAMAGQVDIQTTEFEPGCAVCVDQRFAVFRAEH